MSKETENFGRSLQLFNILITSVADTWLTVLFPEHLCQCRTVCRVPALNIPNKIRQRGPYKGDRTKGTKDMYCTGPVLNMDILIKKHLLSTEWKTIIFASYLIVMAQFQLELNQPLTINHHKKKLLTFFE